MAVQVTERQSSKLMLSWSPGHDGFSPITKCHIRVRLEPAQTTARWWYIGHHELSDQFKVKEVSRRRGEVTTTRLINVTAPPFQHEVPGLQAVTWYNISVSCSNEVGASPVTTWIQSNTTEGGAWVPSAALAFVYSNCFVFFSLSYCAKRFPLQIAVCKNRNVQKRQLCVPLTVLVTKMLYLLDLHIFFPWKVT